MYIAYKVGRFIENHCVSDLFAVWAQNDRDYNWSIVAKPFTKEEAIKAMKEINKEGKSMYDLGGYEVK